ncbi:hypothetical protein A0H81_10604 [Grifola frondosa]|uniref:Uncharacterized protein n=1 Tax=Grifola frondosa TaxID=5627 RepID=A0A1C7LXG7_GRIFR|nr:hypothetical protein A0H81_10604 [Grifola frondosa]
MQLSRPKTCKAVSSALLVNAELWGFVTPVIVKSESVMAAASLVQPYYAVPTDKIDAENLAAQRSVLSTKPEFYSPTMYDRNVLADIISSLLVPPSIYQHTIKSLDLTQSSSSSSQEKFAPSFSDRKSEITSSQESGNVWDGYKEDELPKKTQGKAVRNLRHIVFSLYRRLFGVVFVTNMAVFIATLVQGGANAKQLGLIVVANLFCAIFMHQDYVINAFFTVCCAVPLSCSYLNTASNLVTFIWGLIVLTFTGHSASMSLHCWLISWHYDGEQDHIGADDEHVDDARVSSKYDRQHYVSSKCDLMTLLTSGHVVDGLTHIHARTPTSECVHMKMDRTGE